MITEDLARMVAERIGGVKDFALAVVTHTEGETSVKAGSYAIVLPNGKVEGWIGGSCLRPEISRYGMICLKDGIPRLLRFGPDKMQNEEGGVVDVPMACASGGNVEVFIDPYLARVNIVAIGDSPVSSAIVRIAQVLGYSAQIISDGGQVSSGGEPGNILDRIDKFSQELKTAFVVATHQTYKGVSDADIAAKLIKKEPFYIGIVASHRRSALIRQELIIKGFTEGQLNLVKAPAGISIGKGLKPEEIAL
ncbi:MAG: XdhC family protein, partial [Thermoplasmataceae archaeon]